VSSIELDITQAVIEVLNNEDLSSVIGAADIEDAVRGIVDKDYINDTVDYGSLAEKLDDYIDVDDRIRNYLDYHCSYVSSEDMSEHVVSELDDLLDNYDYDNSCGTWRKFIKAVEDIVERKIPEAIPVAENPGSVKALVREEVKTLLTEPIRNLIIEELAQHEVRRIAQRAAAERVSELMHEVQGFAIQAVNQALTNETGGLFNKLVQAQFQHAFAELSTFSYGKYNEAVAELTQKNEERRKAEEERKKTQELLEAEAQNLALAGSANGSFPTGP
jgi:hypothetical protein